MFRLAVKPLPVLMSGALSMTFAACASKPIPTPSNMVVSAIQPHVWPTPPVAAPGAPPRIVRIWMSSLTIQAGTWLDGTIVASTNVASVEVRTAAFSINSDHVGPGLFRFHTHVLELPPLGRRHVLDLSIIARNTAGVQTVEYASVTIE
jgi:hypothetical protein